MNLTEPQRRLLRSLAHPRKPIVTIGRNGLTDSVLAELERALKHHELVKVKVNIGDREGRNAAVSALCDRTGAELVQRIGFVATLFRRNAEHPVISLGPSVS
ncbi:ribosome assembly RNA-binding protein YhbY [Thioalkalivibrio paradoxus]|uniref:RNA-binding protein n=1 Tax=Thioalkalivibrio paradoxus ARh 1 TaxID=713585 RepID=W0DPV1_9GAMM|nr:ribosome assembly RNA-binding protein YhbY [Thioalkalivibrio paradoxus]AHE99028.1 RNA-binding protein [Thioalkalivibrio paradoxus ARh 1]